MKNSKKLEQLKQEMFGKEIGNSKMMTGGHCCSCRCVTKYVDGKITDVCTPETFSMKP
jgi:hypothetical protein